MDTSEMVFYKDGNELFGGGFKLNDIIKNINPDYITLNDQDNILQDNENNDIIGGSSKNNPYSEFSNLVVPTWIYSREKGMKYTNIDTDPTDVDFISDDLHDKLLSLVSEPRVKHKQSKKNKPKTRTKSLKIKMKI
jgi:hypothetical protein